MKTLAITLLLWSLAMTIVDAKNGLCRMLSSNDFNTPQDWLTLTHSKFTPLPPFRYTTVPAWGTSNVEGLHEVAIEIAKTIDSNYMKDYSIVPRTTDRSEDNTAKKILFIRLGYFNTSSPKDINAIQKGRKRTKYYAYYSILDLIACNVITLKMDNMDPHHLDWSYKVMLKA